MLYYFLCLILRQILRAMEAKRFEEIGSRIRSQRLEAEERKREKETKFTSDLPPAKRARGCTCVDHRIFTQWLIPSLCSGNGAAQPKSLFQKTRTEASKVQKSMFGPQMRPPMLAAVKSYSRSVPTPVLSSSASIKSSPPSPGSRVSSGSRVVVKAYHPRRYHETSSEGSDATTSSSTRSFSPPSSHTSSSSTAIDLRATSQPYSATRKASAGNSTVDNAWHLPTHSSPTSPPPNRPSVSSNLDFTPKGEACLQLLSPTAPYMYIAHSDVQSSSHKHIKKPARSALFMPKHRAYSQLPSGP